MPLSEKTWEQGLHSQSACNLSGLAHFLVRVLDELQGKRHQRHRCLEHAPARPAGRRSDGAPGLRHVRLRRRQPLAACVPVGRDRDGPSSVPRRAAGARREGTHPAQWAEEDRWAAGGSSNEDVCCERDTQ